MCCCSLITSKAWKLRRKLTRLDGARRLMAPCFFSLQMTRQLNIGRYFDCFACIDVCHAYMFMAFLGYDRFFGKIMRIRHRYNCVGLLHVQPYVVFSAIPHNVASISLSGIVSFLYTHV